MKMLTMASLVSLALGTMGEVAHAAEKATPYSWTGFYIGGNAGYGWMKTGASATPNEALMTATGIGDPIVGPLPGAPRADGFIGGGQLGFNARFNALLAGIEADLSYANIDGTTSATGAEFIGGIFHTALETRLDWFGTVRGRLGVLATENLLLYGTGGVAFGDVKTTLTATNLGGCGSGLPYCTLGASGSRSHGWVIGGGAELAIAPAWSLKVEYLHLDFGSMSMTAIDTATPGGAITATSRVTADIVRAGLNYHF